MPLIDLETRIQAPIEHVFDLARSIDAHQASTSHTGERAVGGRTSGLIELGETVTWEARHLGVKQRLSVEITRMERPRLFEDRMIRGAFASMNHMHTFQPDGEVTVMRDAFEFTAPLGILGRLVEWLFLTRYMERFLIQRNQVLKELSESGQWKDYVPTRSMSGRNNP